MGSNDLRSEFRKGLRAVCAGEEPPLLVAGEEPPLLVTGEEQRNWLWGAASCAMGKSDLRSELRSGLRADFAGSAPGVLSLRAVFDVSALSAVSTAGRS